MRASISAFFVRHAKGWIILVAFLSVLICESVIFPRARAAIEGASGGTGPLDMRFFYSAATANAMISSYGEVGRAAYRNTELTTDIFFPAAYTLFLALAISWLFQRAFDQDSPLQYLNLVPLGAWLFDLLENLGIIVMLSSFPRQSFMPAFLTSLFTGMKWAFVTLSLILLPCGVIAYIVRRFPR